MANKPETSEWQATTSASQTQTGACKNQTSEEQTKLHPRLKPGRLGIDLGSYRVQPVSRSLKALSSSLPLSHRVPDVLVVPWLIALVVPMEREVGC